MEQEPSRNSEAGENPTIEARAAAKRLDAINKERNVGILRYLLAGHLCAVCLSFLVAGIVVVIRPIPLKTLVPLISCYSGLVFVFLAATLYVTFIKPTECSHPLPRYVFASGVSNGISLGFLPAVLVGLFSRDINELSIDASSTLSVSEFALFILVSTVNVVYMLHVERTSPCFEEPRRLRIIIAKNSRMLNVFTSPELWIAGCCGLIVNTITLLVLYGMNSSAISTSVLIAELMGKVILLSCLGYVATTYFVHRNKEDGVAFCAQFPLARALMAVGIGLLLIPILDAMMTFLICMIAIGGFAQPGSLYARIAFVVVVVAQSLAGFGLLMSIVTFGIVVASKRKAGVGDVAITLTP
ncbi:hypothetical protein BC830DRAFT_1139670 [Chytriomyces sp. MP71]|nr:hypothetical protein BC830DRAFT_1139670 [Chytriomyces sp. MP71]